MEIGGRKRNRATTSAQRRAIAVSSKIKARFPYAQYGIAHTMRGSPNSLEMFGPTSRSASADQKYRRRALGYYGRGSYVSDAYREAIGAGKAFVRGGSAGLQNHVTDRLYNSPLWGNMAKWSGMGAYNGSTANSNNLILDGKHSDMLPSFSKDETGSFTFSYKEYLADINGSAGFSNQAFVINPGLAATFPFLSQIAQNYEEYTLNQCIFSFKSTIGDSAVANAQIGTVIMACDYNVYNANFGSKLTMMEFDGGISFKASEDGNFGIECDPHKVNTGSVELVRTSTSTVNGDQRLYDHGTFQIATNGNQVTTQIGELWVYYTVTLRKPRLYNSIGFNASYVNSGAMNTPNLWLGSVPTVVVDNMLLVFAQTVTLNSITLTVTVPNNVVGNFILSALTVLQFGLTSSASSSTLSISCSDATVTTAQKSCSIPESDVAMSAGTYATVGGSWLVKIPSGATGNSRVFTIVCAWTLANMNFANNGNANNGYFSMYQVGSTN